MSKKWNSWIVFFDTWHDHEWSQIRGITEKEALIAYGSPQHYFYAGWCSVPPIQNCEEISEGESRDDAGLALAIVQI